MTREFNDILHIGAHFGQERKAYEELCDGRIIWIEADPEIYEQLEIELSSNPSDLQRHLTMNAFVTGIAERKITLNEFSNFGASNSIYKPNRRFKSFWPDIRITGSKDIQNKVTLSYIIQHFKIEGTRNLLVLDIQGHEYEVLQNSIDCLQHFERIVCELTRKRVYKNQPSYRKTLKIIEKAGFYLATVSEMNHFNGHFKRR